MIELSIIVDQLIILEDLLVEVVSFVRVHPKRVVVIDFVRCVLEASYIIEIAIL